MLSGLLLGLIALMRLWPSLPMVRAIHRVTVELPAIWLTRAKRHHILFALLLTALLIGGGEVIAACGSLDGLMIVSFDLSLYLDAVGAAFAIATMTRAKTTYQVFKGRFVAKRLSPNCLKRNRSRDVRSRGAGPSPTNDNVDESLATQAA